LIARIFAETGIKDLFLGVHALIREHANKTATVRLRNKWVEIDPTSWGARSDMSIEIGLGASGKEAELMSMRQEAEVMAQLIQAQGGMSGPLVTTKNVYDFSVRLFEKLGNKTPEKYLSDPEQNQQPQQPPPPDPATVKVQGELQLAQQQAQHDQQLSLQQAQADAQAVQQRLQMEAQKAQDDAALKREQIGAELGLKREQLSAELALKREQVAAELELKREQIHLGHAANIHKTDTNVTSSVRPGGEGG
jgi:hypothetical protein